MELNFEEKDFFSCCGSSRFAKEMALASSFSTFQDAVTAARDIWFNKVDVNGWLEAFLAHPQIGETHSAAKVSDTSAQFRKRSSLMILIKASNPFELHLIQAENNEWSKGEQSTAFATATDSSLQELSEWNARYRQKFGFIFLICASGRSTDGILAELKRRYSNRPIVEFEIAAQEQMKITELRLAKLFSSKANISSSIDKYTTAGAKKAEGGHVSATSESLPGKPVTTRTRPPITTHILDVSRGRPAAGVEVLLEMWKNTQSRPTFGSTDNSWVFQGSSTTDLDGRSGQLLSIVDAVPPGIYRISFNTGKYNPDGFFPYVSIVFEIRESQKREHFHVPLLLSPFAFSTYRGS